MDQREFEKYLGVMRLSPGGPFHSYRLNFNKTITPLDYLAVFFNRLQKIVSDIFPDVSVKKLRILDLGSYEGVYSIPFAQLGAEVVSVEGREVNFKKMKFAKEFLELKRLTVVNADVRTVTPEAYGQFDVVLSCGLMYHLDAPSVFEVTENIFNMTKRAAIIDTHFALSRPISHIYKNHVYNGSRHVEFGPNTAPELKKYMLAHSLDNDESFWLTRISWLNLLKDVGFGTVYESLLPFAAKEMGYYDRMTFVAIKKSFQDSFFPESLSMLSEQIGELIQCSQDDPIVPNEQNLIIR